MYRLCALAGITALVGFLATPAQATPIDGATLIATGGDVVVTFVSNDAGYTSDLFLDGRGDETAAIFNSWMTVRGTSINLGSFTPGAELVFRLFVRDTGNVFYTGDGSRNPDGVVHAQLQSANQQILVGFEDLLGGGDFDYNDLVFSFTNVSGVTAANGGSPGAGNGSGSGPMTQPGGAAPANAGLISSSPLAVDEPGTLVMLGVGLTMIVAALRRQPARR